ncbi:MAG: hypothetical protein GF364_08730 [Candidatus Lokiarchaeota archaeon]|nr:hypothetical protein [Candidatus Lokiarchaeota archaeon]
MGVSRTKSRNNRIPLKKILIVIIFILPMLVISYLLGSAFAYLGALNNYFVNEIEVDTNEFIAPNADFMASAAENWSRINQLYCFPQNLTGDGWDYYPPTSASYKINPITQGIHNESELISSCDIFDPNDPLNELNSYGDTGHATAYSALGLIGEALKYAVYMRDDNLAKAQEQEQFLSKLVKAFSLLSDIDPEGRMARYVLPDTPKARNAFKWFTYAQDDTGTHLVYNYTYKAQNGKEYTYWMETGTSVDLYICVLFGLAMTYRFVNNATIRSIIRNSVDRMLSFFENSGWKFIDLDGKTHVMGSEAVNTKPLADTSYCLAFLLVGKTVHPERWEQIYEDYAINKLYAKKVGKQSALGVHSMFSWAEGYFNIDLMMTIAACLTTLETNPSLERYYRRYLNTVYNIVRKHRNAWFDTVYALGMSELSYHEYESYIKPPRTTLDSDVYNYIEADTADCMMRCAHKKKTGRRFMNPICNDSYNEYTYLSPIPGVKYPDIQYFNWTDLIDLGNPVMKLLSELYCPESAWTHSDGIWDRPIPADWRRTTMMMWEYSPFDTILNTGYRGVQQMPNGDFIAPYWIARYLNFTGFNA